MKWSGLIRSQRRMIAVSSLALLLAVFAVVQVGFRKSEQMLLEKTSRLLAANLEKNEASLWDMLDTARKLSAASSTNKTIAEQLARAAGRLEESGERKTVSTYSSEDLARIREVEALLTNYRNTFFDYQVHAVILGVDGSLYSVLDGVDNSSLFGENFMASIGEQSWYGEFLASPSVSTWMAPCYYDRGGTFHPPGEGPRGTKGYLLFLRKIRDYTTQKELGISVVSLSVDNLETLFAWESMGGAGLLSAEDAVIYNTPGPWEEALPLFAGQRAALTGEGRSGYVHTRLGQGDYLVYYSVLPVTGWRLVNLVPYDTVVAEILELRRYIYLFGLAIAAGAILVCAAILVYMTRPLNRLFARIGEIRIGNRQVGEGADQGPVTHVAEAEGRINRMLDRVEELSQAALELQRMEQNLQYETLRAQLNPHFLFNTLGTIKWSAMVSGAGNIADMISELGRLLESSMRRGEELVPLRSELEVVRAYMEIKNWALKYRYELDIRVPEELQGYRVFKFCLQPLVENAIIHGVEGMEDGRISVTGRREGEALLLEVADNGRGMSAERIAQVLGGDSVREGRGIHPISGVGLSSVDGMIRLRYGEGYGLRIRSEPGQGTAVTVRLPWSGQGEGEEDEEKGEKRDAAGADC